MSTYFWQCPWRAPSKAWKEWDETETIFRLLPIGNTVTAESVSVSLMCYQYFLNSYTSYGFTVTNAESHLMRSCVQETAKEWCNETFFHSQEIGKVFVYRSFWSGVWFPLNKRSCDPHPFNVPWNIGKRKGVIRFNPIALRCPHRLFIHWKTVINE